MQPIKWMPAIVCLVANILAAQGPSVQTLENVNISAQWFLSYQNGNDQNDPYNAFLLKRGYLNVGAKLGDRLSTRLTTDVSVDEEGDGRGDIELRIKYCYLRYKFDTIGWLHKPFIEFGVAHRPWLDYEQSINAYRVQGTMFLERAGMLNSAGYGITVMTLLGETLPESYQERVDSKYPGRWGSLALGVYNGGGYHAIEENENKTVETRLSLRPLPDLIPGLQFSYHGAYGRGNTPDAPKWALNSGFASFETRHLTFTGTYLNSLGNSHGTLVDKSGSAVRLEGYSFFGEIKSACRKFALFGRHDHLNSIDENPKREYTRWIGGLAYYFDGESKILIDYDSYLEDITSERIESRFELAVELRY